jgi:adenine-specific DNA-methyltransferase
LSNTWWDNDSSNQEASIEIKEIFNDKAFDTPKPTKLIDKIMRIATDKYSIILDSFAGSGTTAHAVLNLNKADGGNRKFILVEMCDYAENITAERVRRVINGYGEKEGTGGGFSFYELGTEIFDSKTGLLNNNADTEKIREYVWFAETHTPFSAPKSTNNYLLGTYGRADYYFYYEKNEETTLDWDFLQTITQKADQYIIYADRCLLSDSEMQQLNIVFKKIPRDIKKI